MRWDGTPFSKGTAIAEMCEDARQASREVVDELGRAAAVDDAARVAADEVGRREPEVVHGPLGELLGPADRAPVRERPGEGGCHGLADLARSLGAAGPVELRPSGLERGEPGSDARDVVGHGPEA